jgi:transposase InsO family protein
VSNKINTAYIERSNGTLRQMNSHLQRKSMKFVKENRYFQAKLSVIVTHYNFIKPHGTLSRNQDKSYIPRTPLHWLPEL